MTPMSKSGGENPQHTREWERWDRGREPWYKGKNQTRPRPTKGISLLLLRLVVRTGRVLLRLRNV